MKNYWKDTKLQLWTLFVSGVLTFLVNYIFSLESSFLGMFGLVVFFSSIFHLGFLYWNMTDEWNDFDEEEKPKKTSKTKNETCEPIDYLQELENKMWYFENHIFLEEETHNTLFELQRMLYRVTNKYPIQDAERTFLLQDLPKEILETMELYEKLEVETIKRNTEKKLQTLFIQKKEELEETFILPYEKKREEACLEKIEEVTKKQYQKVYITD